MTRSRGDRVVLVAVLVAGVFLGSRMTGSSAPAAESPAHIDISRAVPYETATPAPAAPSLGCDPAEQLFAAMFVGLTDAALANAGIDREAFLAALAGDRGTLKRYLDALGIPSDNAQLDALIGMGLPGAPGLSFGNPGTC